MSPVRGVWAPCTGVLQEERLWGTSCGEWFACLEASGCDFFFNFFQWTVIYLLKPLIFGSILRLMDNYFAFYFICLINKTKIKTQSRSWLISWFLFLILKWKYFGFNEHRPRDCRENILINPFELAYRSFKVERCLWSGYGTLQAQVKIIID